MGFISDVADPNYLTSSLEIPHDFNNNHAYEGLVGIDAAEYDVKHTKGWRIHDPALRYIHRFLAYNYSGRNDTTSSLSKTELFFLWCMQTKTKIDLGFWFARAFERVVVPIGH